MSCVIFQLFDILAITEALIFKKGQSMHIPQTKKHPFKENCDQSIIKIKQAPETRSKIRRPEGLRPSLAYICHA